VPGDATCACPARLTSAPPAIGRRAICLMTTGWRAPSGFAAIPGVVMSPNGPAAVTPLDEAEQKSLCESILD
jgi:hypothetical protein